LPLIFASWCLPYKTAAVDSQHTWTPFSTIPLLILGNILMEPFAMFIRDVSHVFRKKIQMGMQKMKLKWPATPHQHCTMILAPAQFHCIFLFFIAKKFLQSFSNAFQALRYVEFNLLLKSWSSNRLVNLRTNENSVFHLGFTYFGKFLPWIAKPFVFFIHFFIHIFTKPILIWNESK